PEAEWTAHDRGVLADATDAVDVVAHAASREAIAHYDAVTSLARLLGPQILDGEYGAIDIGLLRFPHIAAFDVCVGHCRCGKKQQNDSCGNEESAAHFVGNRLVSYAVFERKSGNSETNVSRVERTKSQRAISGEGPS